MDMSKYVKMYVSESQERLQRIDGLLLTLEQNGADRAAIDNLFREAHSIKGMSASMGYEELAKVSHRMEDYLDQFRGGKGALERRGVDLLFEGVDLLRWAVEEIAAGTQPTLSAEEYVAKMASVLLARGEAVAPPAPPAPAEQPAAPAPAVAPGPPGPAAPPGRGQFAIDLQIAPDAPLPSARAYITLRRVRDLGELVRSVPSVEQVQAGQFSGGLSMLVATTRSAAEIQAFLASLPDVASVVVRPAEESSVAAPPPPRPSPAPTVPLAPPETRTQPPAEAPRPAPAPAAPPSPPHPPAEAPPGTRRIAMTRVDTRLLDDLMDQVGELVTANGTLREVGQQLDSPPLQESTGRIGALIRELQQQAMKLRMMPLETIVDRFPRAVRDLARKRGKDVTFEVTGKETELDRAILEELPDPIMHILRNAIDHGIEPAEERVRRGKPPAGTIRLEATKEREGVVLRIRDDGHGIDPAVLRRVALERGVITREQADTLPDGDAMMLITLPGFSTAKEVSDVSGRGVGMDVVKTAVESLRGILLIDSVIGQGTTITLKLPLTLVVVAVLLIEAAGARYGLPVSSVEQILEVQVRELQHAQGQEVIAREGMLLPLVKLRHLLGHPPDGGQGSLLVVVSEVRGRLVGVVVDRFIGYREVVVKPLDRALRGVRGFAGVTILGDGSAVLILDLNTL